MFDSRRLADEFVWFGGGTALSTIRDASWGTYSRGLEKPVVVLGTM
jgi:hypothetical protein